ncbi:phage tail protein [Streptomyces yunnanensis]|uniref:Conserved hypothetical phage tail region protein n=1 Tax=Streptomyces yunnanensis TaxID=156453 RepID=A0A9X8N9V6_9ACTN|nr:phage tail protein [Streptomyces yunnanensis]SHN35748.1 conserved hypothetical phage tail region protein [Streptomyces yunnanensis]
MTDQYASSDRFHVQILGLQTFDLGTFSTCEGLDMQVETMDRSEGGVNDQPWKLPTRVTYSNLVLTRPLARASVAFWGWLRSQAEVSVPTLGEIAALGPDREVLMRWLVEGIVPVRWSGPSFSAGESRPGMETLELAHRGFAAVPL